MNVWVSISCSRVTVSSISMSVFWKNVRLNLACGKDLDSVLKSKSECRVPSSSMPYRPRFCYELNFTVSLVEYEALKAFKRVFLKSLLHC